MRPTCPSYSGKPGAFPEAFLAVEVAFERFLTAKGPADLKKDRGIGYQINVEIPKLLGKKNETYTQLLTKINEIRKTRNNIVHQGLSVSEEEATEAIDTITEYIACLNSHIWPQSPGI